MAKLILVRSDHGDGGWSLHNPDATDDERNHGDDILLTGTAEWDDDIGDWDRPNKHDLAKAWDELHHRDQTAPSDSL